MQEGCSPEIEQRHSVLEQNYLGTWVKVEIEQNPRPSSRKRFTPILLILGKLPAIIYNEKSSHQ